MMTFATILRRRVRIKGYPNSGWYAADRGDPDSFEIDFRFAITDDGNGNFLLEYSSPDKQYAADTWHETIEEAYACAFETFGIEITEWSKANVTR